MVLQNIAEKPGIMVKEIADNINLSPATITNILDRLEARGLGNRIRRTYDNRNVSWYCTEHG